MFLKVQITITQYGFDNGLAPTRRQAIIWTNAYPGHWRIYAALGGDELTLLRNQHLFDFKASGVSNDPVIIPWQAKIEPESITSGLFY